MRVCAEPGCPTIISASARGGRCIIHRRAADKARGTTAERGYGVGHQAERRAWQERIDADETVLCWRCGVQLDGTMWHLDHNDARDGYRGPACIPCNLELAGRK